MKKISIFLAAITAAGLLHVGNTMAAGSASGSDTTGVTSGSVGSAGDSIDRGTTGDRNLNTQDQEEFGVSPTFEEERRGLYNRNQTGEQGMSSDQQDLLRDDQGIIQEQEEFGASPEFDDRMDDNVGEQNEFGTSPEFGSDQRTDQEEFGVSPGFDQENEGAIEGEGPYDQPLTDQDTLDQRGTTEDQEEFGVSPGFDENRRFPAERDSGSMQDESGVLEEPDQQQSFPQDRTNERY